MLTGRRRIIFLANMRIQKSCKSMEFPTLWKYFCSLTVYENKLDQLGWMEIKGDFHIIQYYMKINFFLVRLKKILEFPNMKLSSGLN